ncbi:MAG: LPS export ABC transporter periplasmic protein LptC [Pseudomonadota bacterium]
MAAPGPRREVDVYSRLVRWAKVILPLASVLLVGAIFLIDRDYEDSFLPPGMAAELGAGMQLENPRFAGVTEAGEPFTISARRALPDGPVPDLIELDAPEGDIGLSDGLTLTMTATSGVVSRSEQTLTLTGKVKAHSSDGYRAETGKLVVNLDQKTVFAPNAIYGFGPTGSISAGLMRAARNVPAREPWSGGTVIRFEGGVTVVFIPGEAR